MPKKNRNKKRTHVAVRNITAAPNVFTPIGGRENGNKQYWRWGDDNCFPYAVAALSRRSVTHRRVMNDKADYIAGKGFIFDENNTVLKELCECANCNRESLHDVFKKISLDYTIFGNAFLEVVTDRNGSFV